MCVLNIIIGFVIQRARYVVCLAVININGFTIENVSALKYFDSW